MTHERRSAFKLKLFAIFLESWAVMCLWSWFMVPLGVVSINFAHAMGLGILANLITGQLSAAVYGARHTEDQRVLAYGEILAILLVLGTGWVAHFFV